MPITKIRNRKKFLNKVNEDSLQDINLCYQCGRCTAGCPMADEMDIPPARIIHAIRLGQADLVKNSKTLWICASCQTCTARCPHGIDIAGAIDAARRFVFAGGKTPRVKNMGAFHKSFLESIQIFGRIYELGLIGAMKLRTLNFFSDTVLGIKMFVKGKMSVLPHFKSIGDAKEIFKRVKEVEKK